MATLYPVIMCGGAGTRLWPLSRKATPKQYLSLVEERTLLQATAARLGESCVDISVASPVIICGAGQESIVAEQLAAISKSPSAIILEPEPRNTAAVAAVAARHALNADPDAVVLLLAADHHISMPDVFWSAVETGCAPAMAGDIVTFGIHPEGPETGYGYIRAGEDRGDGVHAIDAFVEKPDAKTAQAYLDAGGYTWNSGNFLFRADAMVAEFEAHAPEILAAATQALDTARRDKGAVHLDTSAFAAAPSEPVDTAIMEKTQRAVVVSLVGSGWNDIGSWSALADLVEDPARGDVIAMDCSDTMIRSDGPLVAAVGLEGFVVIATGDSVLILPKERSQDVKKIVANLKKDGRAGLL